MGIAENGFREITNSKHEIKSVDDMKNLKVRVAGSNLLMECYKRWGADATNMNWSETYTALQQNTVEGQENPLPAIDAASVQEVQPYCSMWDAIYDCLFFCITKTSTTVSHHNSRKLLTRQDRKQLNMSVTSTAPEMTRSKNAGQARTV